MHYHVSPLLVLTLIYITLCYRTLNECKGLEFNDVGHTEWEGFFFDNLQVLVYHFFGDSPANASKWRLVMGGTTDGTYDVPVPEFDETKHASICVEVSFSTYQTFSY